MLSVNRKAALAGVSAAAVLVGAIVVSAPWGGLSSAGGSAPAIDPRPCVATVLPDAHYQAIAEMNACTGSSVIVEMPPSDIRWTIAGNSLPPGTGVSRTDP